jgi:hypothetical protein
MPDTEYRPDGDSEELARKLASNTVADLRQRHESSNDPDISEVSLERHAEELGVNAPLHDVTAVMREFAWQWEFSKDVSGPMPCVQIGSDDEEAIVPISIPFDWPYPRTLRSWRRYYPFPPEYLYAAYQEILRSRTQSEEISFVSPDNVLEQLQNDLGRFLAYRISGFKAWMGWMMGGERSRRVNLGGNQPPGGSSGSGGPPPPGSWSPGGGFGVDMWCNTPSLTIEFSHAYFIHWLNFGAPSFPVKNMLFAGRYVFQGKGPTYPSGTPRSQVFRIPPDYKAVTTYF